MIWGAIRGHIHIIIAANTVLKHRLSICSAASTRPDTRDSAEREALWMSDVFNDLATYRFTPMKRGPVVASYCKMAVRVYLLQAKHD